MLVTTVGDANRLATEFQGKWYLEFKDRGYIMPNLDADASYWYDKTGRVRFFDLLRKSITAKVGERFMVKWF